MQMCADDGAAELAVSMADTVAELAASRADVRSLLEARPSTWHRYVLGAVGV